MTLTKEQLAFFDTFGFIKFTGAFREEADRIIEAFEEVWFSHGGGHNEEAHDYKRRSAILPFIDQSEYLSSLIDHLSDRRVRVRRVGFSTTTTRPATATSTSETPTGTQTTSPCNIRTSRSPSTSTR